MKKTMTISAALLGIVFLAGCGQQVGQAPTTKVVPITEQPTTIQLTNKNLLRAYTNDIYHFSLQIPKKIYSTNCKTNKDVQVDEKGAIITIGAKFNCSERSSSQGWTIFASNNISGEKDAQIFLDKVLGKGCKISEWGNSIDNEPNAFFIESLNSTHDNPFGDCDFGGSSKYRTFYSPRLQTAIFWSLDSEPQFTSEDGSSYDDEVLRSFKFINTDQTVVSAPVAEQPQQR